MTDTPPLYPAAGLIDCRVRLGDVAVAYGEPSDARTAPYALSGLSVEWGRSTTVEQPGPSSCRFTIADPVGDQVAGVRAYVGQTVTVTAATDVPGAPTVSTHHDPTWSSWPAGPLGAAGTISPSTAAAVIDTAGPSGRRSVRIDMPMTGPGGIATVLRIPPRPFVAAGTAPAAWDAVPKMTPGETWRAGLSLWLPVGVVAFVYPMSYSAPWRGTGRRIAWRGRGDQPLVVQTTSAETWTTVTDYLQTPDDPGWLGLEVELWDTADALWSGRPAGETYDTTLARTYLQLGQAWLDDVQLLAPAAGTRQEVSVFAGRITDVAARYSPGAGMSLVDVTAADFIADLGNVFIGDQPWPAETVQARMQRILALAGVAMTLLVDPRPAAIVVGARDVDRRSAAELLADTASSVDAVLRAAVHPVTGPYVRVEDPGGRPALRQLALGAGGVVTIVPVAAPAGATVLPADLVEMDGTEWQQSVADVVNRVQVSWQEQTNPPTERFVTMTDDPARGRLGERSATLSTDLTTSAAAQAVAQQLLARLSDSSWRIAGLAVDTTRQTLDTERIATLVPLLDGTARIGRPLQLTGVPQWWPGPATDLALYLEGATLTHDAGCWRLDLVTSSPNGLGQSAAYYDLPDSTSWSYSSFPPELNYSDLTGVAGP